MKKIYSFLCAVAFLSFLSLKLNAQVTLTATAGTGTGSFTTLKDAFDAVNAGTHQGSIVISINGNTTETAPCVLNSGGAGSALYSDILIRPTVTAVISGTTATGRGVIELNGADNVTIDGAISGNSRDLTITNAAANTVTYTSVVRVAVAATIVTSANAVVIKNLVINGSATGRNISTATSTSASENTTYGIYAGSGASTTTATTAPSAITSVSSTVGTGATMNGLTITNNIINACARGIAVQGSATNVINNLTVSNNTVGAATAGNTTTVYTYGITIQGFTAATVAGNLVRNIESFVATSIRAFDFGTISATGTNATVENNIVSGVNSRALGGYGAYGMCVVLSTASNSTFRNNFIYGILKDMSGSGGGASTFVVNGIRIGGGTNYNIYHNSVNLSGALYGTATAQITSCLAVVSTTYTGINVRNNIFSNTLTGTPANSANVCLYLPVSATSTFNLTLNNNAYFTGTTAGAYGIAQAGTTYTNPNTAGVGLYTAPNFNAGAITPTSNFRSYSSAFSASGNNDNASYASTGSAPFISSTNLHLDNAAPEVVNVQQKGDATTGVTTDIDGDARPDGATVAPDMGADEIIYAAPSCPAVTSVAISSITAVSASVSFAGTGTAFIVEYGPAGFTPGTGAAAGAGGFIATGTSSPIGINGLTQNTLYDVYVRRDCTGSANGYSSNSSKISFTTPALCPAPLSVTVTGVTTTGANVSWTGTGNFILEYGSAGFVPGTGVAAGGGTVITGTGTSQSLSLLSPGSSYDVYVRQDCTGASNGYSFNSVKATFSTPVANDECSTAVTLTVQSYVAAGTCPGSVSGTTVGATLSSATAPPTSAFSSSQDDDVWYEFTATGTSHIVRLCNVNFPVGAAVQMGIVLNPGCLTGSAEISGTPSGSLITLTGNAGEMSFSGLTAGAIYKIRVLTSGTGSRANFDISVLNAASMTYVSSTSSQPVVTTVTAGSTAQQIIRAEVVVLNTGNPLSVTDITFNTTGTTVPADITSARVYYTGTSTTFSTTTPFGTAVVNPNGTFSVSGLQVLTGTIGSNATNYFFLVYDISCNAVAANILDAEVTQITVGGIAQTPTLTAPAQSRTITALYAPARTDANTATAVGPGAINARFVYALVSGSSVCPGTVTAVNFTATNTNPADVTAKCYYTTTSTFSTANPFGTAISGPSGALTFSGSQLLATGNNYFWVVYDINCAATIGGSLNADINSLVVNGNTISITGTATAANLIAAATSYTTVADGEWNNSGTWACGNIPVTNATGVTIAHNITVSNTGNIGGSVTVNSGASLTVSGGDLTLGTVGGGNISFVDNGTLTVSGGTLNINGNLSVPSGGKINQSGGFINVDGNAAGVVANSVASGTSIVNFVTAVASDCNLTGGVFTIVDPHVATTITFSSGLSVVGSVIVPPTHTFRFGDGVSTDNGGSAGFKFYSYSGSGIMTFGNVIIEANTGGTNRFVELTSTFYNMVASGDITINNGGELKQVGTTATGAIVVGKNLTVNTGGVLTTPGIIYFGSATSTTSTALGFSASVQPQSINGGGTFRNSATPTANLASVTVNNTNASGLTFNTALNMSGTLTMTAGVINTTNVNLLTLGYNATNAGTLTYTAGRINGPFKRWITAATGARVFPVGSILNYKPATINFTTAPTAGTLTASFSTAAPSFPNASPLVETAATPNIVVNAVSKQGSWIVGAADGLTGGAYTATFTGNGATDISDFARTALIKRPVFGTGDWSLDGTHVTTTGSNTAPVVSRTAINTGFSEFAIGGEANVVLPVSLQYFRGAKQTAGNNLDWKIDCTSGLTITLERSADKISFKGINTQNATADRCLTPFNYLDGSPLAGANYYRLKLTTPDGFVKYSNIVLLINKDKGFEFVNLIPNPVKNSSVLNMSSAKAGKVELSVTDISGKLVMKQSTNVIAGSNALTLNFITLAAGTYQITAVNDDADVQTLRFVKY